MDSEKERYLASKELEICAKYDELAGEYPSWLERYGYYYERKLRLLRHLIPKPGRVLDVGCGLGQNLVGLNPAQGVGIDTSGKLLEEARRRYPVSDYPQVEFRELSALRCGELEGTFDTVLLVNSMSEIGDLVGFFAELRRVCTPDTRVVHLSYNYLLVPFVKAAGLIGLAPRHPVQNWLTRHDFENVRALTGFELVREGYDMVVPFGIPWLSDFVNRFLPLIPLLHPLCMMHFSVLRPVMPQFAPEECSVTVCVPCRNEEGNIAGLVERIPSMGKGTEIIFVDDRSTDATAERVRQEMEAHPEKSIKLVNGPGEGKGAACRAGFAHAENDVLMILDADMTVMPEDLPSFFDALVSSRGEFINGSRLVYPMEDRAMKFANIIGNKLFALLFSFVLSQRLKDTLCGTKVIWRRHYERLLESRQCFGSIDRWGDYDWIFGAARHNLKIIELPIHYRERKSGETKMTKRLNNALVMLRMCNVAFWKVKLF